MLPILIFAAAGALAGGGLGGGWLLWQKGTAAAAEDLRQQDVKAVKRLLESELDLATLKREAREAGVDVEAVVAGFEAMKAKQLQPEDVVRLVMDGQAPVPGGSGGQKPKGLPRDVEAVSSADMRSWARAHGLEISDRGRIPNRVMDAYRAAH